MSFSSLIGSAEKEELRDLVAEIKIVIRTKQMLVIIVIIIIIIIILLPIIVVLVVVIIILCSHLLAAF